MECLNDVSMSMVASSRTLPREIRWNWQPRAQAVLWATEASPGKKYWALDR